jgi:hypothetical protein
VSLLFVLVLVWLVGTVTTALYAVYAPGLGSGAIGLFFFSPVWPLFWVPAFFGWLSDIPREFRRRQEHTAYLRSPKYRDDFVRNTETTISFNEHKRAENVKRGKCPVCEGCVHWLRPLEGVEPQELVEIQCPACSPRGSVQ